MSFVTVGTAHDSATVTMSRGKVNALNAQGMGEIREVFRRLEADDSVRAVVLTGNGSFFSFGFDVPELLTYSRDALTSFLTDFTGFLHDLFVFPKPVVAGINGHATAGGCMLALCCDYRVMVDRRVRISLNEINIGVPVFAGITAILQHVVGARNAEIILTEGLMYSADDAAKLGLVDDVQPIERLATTAAHQAAVLGSKLPEPFAAIKALSRAGVADRAGSDGSSIARFVDLWFTEESQALLRTVQIRS